VTRRGQGAGRTRRNEGQREGDQGGAGDEPTKRNGRRKQGGRGDADTTKPGGAQKGTEKVEQRGKGEARNRGTEAEDEAERRCKDMDRRGKKTIWEIKNNDRSLCPGANEGPSRQTESEGGRKLVRCPGQEE